MSWLDLIKLRHQYANDPEIQAYLAPYEHRAYYREYATPLTAGALAVAEPAYQGLKYINALPSGMMTTPASIRQITESWKGIGEGMFR